MHLPFVICRLWRLIGFHGIDVDCHLNTVGIKLFYTLNKTLSMLRCNVQCKRIHERSMYRLVAQLNYALPMGLGWDDKIHGNYHNNEFHTVHIQRPLFLVLFHTFDIATLRAHKTDRLLIPLCDMAVDFVRRRHQRKQFYDKSDRLMNTPHHLQTAGIKALVNSVCLHMSWVSMYKSRPNQLRSKCSLYRPCPDPTRCYPMYLSCPYSDRRWNCSAAMWKFGPLDLVNGTMTMMTTTVDDLRALDEFEPLQWSLYCYCCWHWHCYYLQFVLECPAHMLNTKHDSMAKERDLRTALYTTNTVILPPLH